MSENMVFRYLTPVFEQSYFVDFEHTGRYEDATYSVSLKGYRTDPSLDTLPLDDLKELLKYGSEGTLRNLRDMDWSLRFIPPYTNVVLVVDVTQPLTDERKVAGNTRESGEVFRSVVSALRLHMSRGLAYEYTYQFRWPHIDPRSPDELPEEIQRIAKESPGCAVRRPHTIPVQFSPLGSRLSVLRADQYDDCQATIEKLLEKKWDDTDTFDKILQLALEYHKTSLTLENTEHAFLILMVAFEALFKKKSERNAGRAAGRIAKLLASAENDNEQIKRDFFDDSPETFCNIRNDIAHGDPNLDHAIVKARFPKLYRYASNAIIALLNLPNGTIGADYYDDLSTYVDSRFAVLPPT